MYQGFPGNSFFIRLPGETPDEQLKSWDKVLTQSMKDSFFKKAVDSQKAWSRRIAFYDLMNTADYKLAYKHYFPDRITS